MFDITGQTFGRLTVMECIGHHIPGDPAVYWRCACSCGGALITRSQLIREGRTKSCGCLRRERSAAHLRKLRTRHGMTNTRAWKCWSAMLDRCENPKNTNFPRYGGRGIAICDQWLTFENFYADMGDPPPGMSIDRIDNDKGYEPDNCRWAPPEVQCNNKSDNVRIEFGGVTHTATQWARIIGVAPYIIHRRIKSG